MSIKRDITDFMFDIHDSICDIRLFVQDMIYEEFIEDQKTINAVIRSLEIIGEVSSSAAMTLSNLRLPTLCSTRSDISGLVINCGAPACSRQYSR